MGSQLFLKVLISLEGRDSHSPVPLLQRSDRPAASETCNNAAPAFVQLGVVGADVAPYIPQSEERLTAELHGGWNAQRMTERVN